MTVQADLLAYFGQQLVAHGAILFAVLTAAFTFMGTMRPKNQNLRGILVYVGIGGGLIGAGLYTFCRMLWYGALVNGLIGTSCSREDLGYCFSIFVGEAKKNLSNQLPYRFIALFSGSINYVWPLIACVFAGIFLALMIFSIGVAQTTTRRVILSILILLPAIVVFALAMLQWV